MEASTAAVMPENPVAEAVLRSCLGELAALKPGSVGRHADGHGMVVEQFRQSAYAIANTLGRRDGTIGSRILASVRATLRAVGCNTNLGIVLLGAPLTHAMFLSAAPHCALRERVRRSLRETSVQEAQDAFDAIRLAQPAGLGHSREHDVHEPACVTLLEAMRVAADRDRIAYEYASGYEGVFESGLPTLADWLERGAPFDWAVVGVYLDFLADIPDSHIVRKFGRTTATEVMSRGGELRDRLYGCDRFEQLHDPLMEFDAELKHAGINPGTSADLTVATLLAFHLQNLLRDAPPLGSTGAHDGDNDLTGSSIAQVCA